MKKRFYSIFLAITMVLNIFVPSVLAEGYEGDSDINIESEDSSILEKEDNIEDVTSTELTKGSENLEEEKSDDEIDVTSPDTIINQERKVEDSKGKLEKRENRATGYQFTFTQYNYDGVDGYQITGIREFNGGELEFPEKYNGKPVLSIGKHALKGKKIEGDINLPDSYKHIGEGAFERNNLNQVVLNKVEIIDVWAFNSSQVKELVANNVVTIGEKAFEKNNLTSLSLPNVKELELAAFKNNNIEEISLENVEKIGKEVFENNKLQSVTLPNVKEIDVDAFKNNEIVKINLEKVELIEGWAFSNNNSKSSDRHINPNANIANNAFIGNPFDTDGTFYFEKKLDKDEFIVNDIRPDKLGETIEFPEKYEGNPVTGIKESAFNGNTVFRDKTVIIPESYKEIGKWAFKGTDLSGLVLLGETKIGEGSFENNNLTEVNLPKVKEIGIWAFANNKIKPSDRHINKEAIVGENAFIYNPIETDGVFIFDLAEDKENFVVVGLDENIKELDDEEIKFPEEYRGKDVIAVSDNAFNGDEVFEGKTVIIPESYKEIGKWAFRGTKISGLVLPGETKIGEGSFENNNLTEVNLPKVKEIDIWAFNNNEIESLNSPLVETIGEYAFNNNKLTELDLPKLKKIDAWAFHNNEIKKLNLPLVEIIGESAFYKNESLDGSVSLESLSEIGPYAFGNTAIRELRTKKTFTIIPYKNEENGTSKVTSFPLPIPDNIYIDLFPIFIENYEAVNEIDFENKLVYNPVSDGLGRFEEAYEEKLKDLEILNPNNNEVFIWRSYNDNLDKLAPLLKAYSLDKKGEELSLNEYYCIDSSLPVYTGVYKLIENVEKVYVKNPKGDSNRKLSYEVKGEEIKEDIDYDYSYDMELLSKLIYHMRKNGIKDSNLHADTIHHLIDSNPEITGKIHLTSENFIDVIKTTGDYANVAYVFEEKIDKIFEDVKSDKRKYTSSTIAEWVDKDIFADDSQTLINPGKPIGNKIEISVKKEWIGEKADEVIINLLKNNKPIKSVKLNEDNKWEHTFDNLDEKDQNGEFIEYTVEEVEIPGYKTIIRGDKDKGFIVINIEEQNCPTCPEPETPEQPECPTCPECPECTEPDTPDKPGIDTPDKPEPDTPDKPGIDTPDKPGTDTPDKPGTDTPDKPGIDTPDKPGTDTPDKPVIDTPDKPNGGVNSGNNTAPQTGDAGLAFTASTMLLSAAAFVASKKKRK